VLVASLSYLLQGALVTLWLSVLVVGVGTLLGAGIGILAAVSGPPVQRLITAYVFILRGVPVLVVMFLGYYLFPAVGYRVNAYVAVGVAQIVYVSAFVAEIIRSAIASVPPGQVAAANGLGMRRSALLREFSMPQATRIAR